MSIELSIHDNFDEFKLTVLNSLSSPEAFERILRYVAEAILEDLKQKSLEMFQEEYRHERTGELADSWYIGEIHSDGTTYSLELINDVDFGKAVEYGHIQHPGQYVPKIRKTLKKDYVEGKHMIQRSINDIGVNLIDDLKANMELIYFGVKT
jgi:hypothetical protein